MALDPDDAKLIAQAKAAAAKAAATPATSAVPNFTPTVTMGANTSGLFVGPIPTGTTRTATGYTTTPATPDIKTTTTWVRAGSVLTANGIVDVDANGKAADGSTPVKANTTTPGTYTQAELDAKIAAALATQTANQKAANQANVSTAIEDFRASLKLAGLDSLADTIDTYIKQDMTAAQIKINLTTSDAYKQRFPGMDALAKAGRAVNEATYISMERGYEQVLGAYGLDTKVFGTREKLGTYIAGEVSPAEFENRVQIAADRVEKNPDVLAALKDYYGVDKSGAVAYLLDPTLGMDIVKKQTRAAEIGAAATAAGFTDMAGEANKGVAESFINASGTQDLQALKTQFGNARLLANTQERLAQIENGNYKDTDAITAVLGQDAEKIMESQKRAAREVARFSGSSGVGTQSLRNNAVSNI